jgi:hypothetical protein
MRGVFDSGEIDALEKQLALFQELFSATILMLADEKGKVRITVPTLNEVKMIGELHYEQNAAGAYIIEVTKRKPEPESEPEPAPDPPPLEKPKPKSKAAKK